MAVNFLLDNLAAVIIGVAVIMMLSVSQIRSSQAGVEQVAAHAAKAKMLSFGEWVEDDLVSLGANIAEEGIRFLDPTVDADGNTTDFTFFSDSLAPNGSAFDTIRVMTRYHLVETRTMTVGDSTHQLYQMRRETSEAPVVNGAVVIPTFGSGSWTADGRSVETLSFFEIEPLNRHGQATSVASADFLQIRMAMVPEILLDQGYLRELFWTTTLKIRPFWEHIDDEEEEEEA